MTVQTDAAVLFEKFETAFEQAVEDVVRAAQDRAPRRTGKFAASIQARRVPAGRHQLEAIVGSPLASARVKEKGGYITPKKHDTLYIAHPDGKLRRPKAVRIRAQPTVAPAGRRFDLYMTARMREQAR